MANLLIIKHEPKVFFLTASFVSLDFFEMLNIICSRKPFFRAFFVFFFSILLTLGIRDPDQSNTLNQSPDGIYKFVIMCGCNYVTGLRQNI